MKTTTSDGVAERPATPMRFDVDAYASPDFVALEKEKLWGKVWLQAGRTEEIPEIGSYITFDIADQSVLIVRTGAQKIEAFHNVCQHRGRRLVDTPAGSKDASGSTQYFKCGFHGWCWNIAGENIHVPARQDWNDCLTADNLRLASVKTDTWGGWIWVNLNPDCESLQDFLGPIPQMLDPFCLKDMRFKWRRWAVFDCNWKVAMEAFNETYHVRATHPEYAAFGTYNMWARVEGLHCALGYDAPEALDEASSRVRLGNTGDPRITTAKMVAYTMKHADVNFTQTLLEVALRLEHDLPEGTPAPDVLKYWLDTARKKDAARGVVWPVVDPAHAKRSGFAWQVFPNFRIGHAVNNALCYYARPYGTDPNRCIFETSAFELYPVGEEPRTQWEHVLPGDAQGWGRVLAQDFRNMEAVQKGMKSKGFKGPRPNPKEEHAVTALHAALAEWLGTAHPTAL